MTEDDFSSHCHSEPRRGEESQNVDPSSPCRAPQDDSKVRLLEGKTLVSKIQEDIKSSIQTFLSQGLEIPRLLVISVGDNASSKWYVDQQKKLAGKLGIEFDQISSERTLTQKDLEREINAANQQSKVHGIFITMPLPKGFDADKALLAMDPRKDVEGIHPTSLGLMVLRKSKLIPPTAYASLRLIESVGAEWRGKRAAIVGQSAIVGRPLQLLLGERRVTTTVCNTGTSTAELEKIISESDLVIACAGQPGLVKGTWIKPGAVVIDVGTTEINGKLVGDVEFEPAKARAGWITPVPGGVGPLTVTMLMQNLIHAYRWQKGI